MPPTDLNVGFDFRGEFCSERRKTLLAPPIAAPASVFIGPALIAFTLIPFSPKSLARYLTDDSRALESSVRYLASDLGENGIRVNAISAGPMKTLAGAAIGGARRVFRLSEQNSPLKSNPTLRSVGGTAAFLLSDYGMHVTGEVIFVDGGYHVMGMPKLDNIEKA